jgi:hypothetical protein
MQRLELFQSIIQHTDQIDVDMEDDINFTCIYILANMLVRCNGEIKTCIST